MQRHEGPGRDHGKEERLRQRGLTWRLAFVILVLLALIAVLLVQRWI